MTPPKKKATPAAPVGVGRVINAHAIDAAQAPGPLLMRSVSDAVTELEAAHVAAGENVARGGRGMAADVVIIVATPGKGPELLELALNAP